MLIAEIRHKLLDLESVHGPDIDLDTLRDLLSEAKEDLLTADVFGALKYLPRVPFLSNVLNTIGTFNPQASEYLSHLPLVQGHPEDFTFFFWPTYATPSGIEGGSTEPDAVISSPSTLLFVEAKLNSGFGTLQIERELAIGLREAGQREFFLLLVTRSGGMPRFHIEGENVSFTTHLAALEDRREISTDLAADLRAANRRILTISWSRLFRAIERADAAWSDQAGQLAEKERARDMVDDLRELMVMRGIDPFRGLTGNPFRTQCTPRRPIVLSVGRSPHGRFGGINSQRLPQLVRFQITEFAPLPLRDATRAARAKYRGAHTVCARWQDRVGSAYRCRFTLLSGKRPSHFGGILRHMDGAALRSLPTRFGHMFRTSPRNRRFDTIVRQWNPPARPFRLVTRSIQP